ncbi:adenylyl-sulfate kinase [Shewanella morhuae]|uniref:Adenylyl-sulfate kinase n=1 Tax=Shewanella morhuae TaxID=365591 RepID=A0A380A819_9GAMM|nr:adenylyl-sulfate kinase [Shewanella morhuae]SUI76027.1 Adenylyl-sulfate kinase [Shewanella morhuae]
MRKSGVFWITGLPGSGKTTFGKALVSKLSEVHPNVVHLDGDDLRDVFNNYGFSRDERYKIAQQYSRLTKLLVDQGLLVVFSTVSLFHDIHEWNRINLKGYVEIYLDPGQMILVQRNKKKLYDIDHKSHSEIVGKGINPEFPKSPDYTFYSTSVHDLENDIKVIINHI